MRICILSQSAKIWSTAELVRAAKERGHDVEVVDYRRCYMNITSNNPMVMYGGRRLDDFDAVIPRIAASLTYYGTAVVRQFEAMGVFCANSSLSIARSRDKLRCMQILAQRGIGLPVSACAHSSLDIDGIIDIAGGAPVVVKLIEGTQGVGVVLCETRKAAQSVIEAFRQLDAHLVVQEFIEEAKGADIRAFVVGGKVVASMMRQAAAGEFRSNLHRGGSAKKLRLTPEERAVAIRSAKSMGLNVAGVDMLRSNHGPVVMEVNSSPGLEGITGATKLDVASKIVEFVERNEETPPTRDRIEGK